MCKIPNSFIPAMKARPMMAGLPIVSKMPAAATWVHSNFAC